MIADELRRLAPEAVLALGGPARWAREQDGALRRGRPTIPMTSARSASSTWTSLEVVALGGLAARWRTAADRPPLPMLDARRRRDRRGGRGCPGGGDGAAGGDARPDDEDRAARAMPVAVVALTMAARERPRLVKARVAPTPRTTGCRPSTRPSRSPTCWVVERADAGLAAVATARASGARVVALAGTDPRTDRDAIAALAEARCQTGSWRSAAASAPPTAGAGGSRWPPPASSCPAAGRWCSRAPHGRATATRAHRCSRCSASSPPTPRWRGRSGWRPATTPWSTSRSCPLEIITTVASGAAGPRRLLQRVRGRRPASLGRRRGRAGMYVMLDLQPGRTDFLTQAQRYEELLAEPHVGLALDPEWRLGPNQRHMAQIGSVGVDEVNAVAAWLAGLTWSSGCRRSCCCSTSSSSA